MYYRIAELILLSQINLPSFSAFACDPAPADVTISRTDEIPCKGEKIISGNIVHRLQPDGWFCYNVGMKRAGLLISSDYTRLRLVGRDVPIQLVEHYIRLALECLLIRRGYVSIHAAAVELDDEAIAFTGPSGIGKSTRAQAWINDLGASLISGDRPLIRVETMELFGVPWDGKEGCFRSVNRKLKAICDVRRDGPCYVRKLSVSQSRRLLLRQSFLPMWDTETAALQMNNIFQLASSGRIVRTFGGVSSQEVKHLYSIIQREDYLEEVTELKAKPGFILRNVVNEYMLMPTGENISEYGGVVLLNRVSAFIWEKLQSPVSRDDLLAAVLHEFEVDENKAAEDLDMLLQKLDQLEILDKE